MTSLLEKERERIADLKVETERLVTPLIHWLEAMIEQELEVNGRLKKFLPGFSSVSCDSIDLILLMTKVNANSESTRISIHLKSKGFITNVSAKIDTVSNMVTYKLF